MQAEKDLYSLYADLLDFEVADPSICIQIDEIVTGTALKDARFSERAFLDYLFAIYSNVPHVYEQLMMYRSLFLPR